MSIMEHRVRAAGLLVQNNRILLVLHRHPVTGDEWWIPPGGGLQSIDRTIFDTARREIFEETGLEAKLSRISYIREFRAVSTNTYHLELFMPVDSFSGEITLDNVVAGDLDEEYIQDVRWLNRSQMQELVVWPEWIKEDWFWQDARAGFPKTRYTGVGIE